MNLKDSSILDTTAGPIIKPLIAYSVPIMLANVLQLLFNAADIIVVGQFVGKTAVAAVGGSTAVFISMMVSLFTGLSVGATVLLATRVGEGSRDLTKIVHTTYTLGLLLGLFVAVAGFFIAPYALRIMNTPSDVIDQADIYLGIYFLGQPGFMVYTFSRAVLVAKGDTRSPLNYLLFAGVANVILNVLFVKSFHLDVAGVAIATIISQYISAVLTTRKLRHLVGEFHLSFRCLCLDLKELKKIARLGVPTGLQGTLIAVSAILLQSSVNSLSTDVVAGQSAANSIMSIGAQALNAFSQGCMTFAGQNYGARKKERLRKIFRSTLLIDGLVGAVFALFSIFCGKLLLGIYISDSAAAIDAGMVGITTSMGFAFLLGFQDTSCFMLRGMNRSLTPMLTSLFGNCVFRVAWILLVFRQLALHMETLQAFRLLLVSYPIAWLIIFLLNLLFYRSALRKF